MVRLVLYEGFYRIMITSSDDVEQLMASMDDEEQIQHNGTLIKSLYIDLNEITHEDFRLIIQHHCRSYGGRRRQLELKGSSIELLSSFLSLVVDVNEPPCDLIELHLDTFHPEVKELLQLPLLQATKVGLVLTDKNLIEEDLYYATSLIQEEECVSKLRLVNVQLTSRPKAQALVDAIEQRSCPLILHCDFDNYYGHSIVNHVISFALPHLKNVTHFISYGGLCQKRIAYGVSQNPYIAELFIDQVHTLDSLTPITRMVETNHQSLKVLHMGHSPLFLKRGHSLDASKDVWDTAISNFWRAFSTDKNNDSSFIHTLRMSGVGSDALVLLTKIIGDWKGVTLLDFSINNTPKSVFMNNNHNTNVLEQFLAAVPSQMKVVLPKGV